MRLRGRNTQKDEKREQQVEDWKEERMGEGSKSKQFKEMNENAG